MATDEQRSALRSSLISLPISIGIVIALVFVPAGTLNWPQGWAFTLVLVVLMAIAIPLLWRINPDIFVARRSVHAGTKSWDILFVLPIIGGFLLIPVLAGLDYRWSLAQATDWLVWLGYGLFTLSFAAQIWAQGVNPHFEPTVRIQSDRAHKVIDTGPYGLVRHPGYVSGSTLALGMALALGSLAAILPAMLVVAALILRTRMEDRILQKELPGYADYALRVRFKWVPSIW